MPHAEKGNIIGLYGGSFNPPHKGHVLVADIAITRLRLDKLWWMVTPGNPLKSQKELRPLSERIGLSEGLISDPHIKITAFEQAIETRFSADTINHILQRNVGVHFVWIMGADSLKNFHLWQHWQDIARKIPIAIIDRPGATIAALSSVTARRFAQNRIDERLASGLALMKPPAWTFIHGPRSSLSSTQLRQS
ncbi:nicotinate-nucleotide adenylyltransferase [Bartonella sp. HY406]|uniref:nicotinate-nucleotide adenylyltransferase n=1 Tax=Bartonella sp. HY406 TaxID=2979331 RepID=UPI0021C98E81|nr:nicotinate-nucleotide adenylyltransferase [Bartonella sp. HY406]UXN04818.1 nicotinate-nucleotide adenylyltransferase [Bartonella sp. HY406]